MAVLPGLHSNGSAHPAPARCDEAALHGDGPCRWRDARRARRDGARRGDRAQRRDCDRREGSVPTDEGSIRASRGVAATGFPLGYTTLARFHSPGRRAGPKETSMEKNTTALSPAEAALRDAALEYHRSPVRGKIAVTPTKPLSNQRDLSLAYSPGVAYACLAIEADPVAGARLHRARQPRRRRHQRHRGAGSRRHRPAGRQAGDGGQGLPVPEVRRHRRVRHRTGRARSRTSWSTSSPRSSPRWAASTSRTSRRPSASTSRRSCASA